MYYNIEAVIRQLLIGPVSLTEKQTPPKVTSERPPESKRKKVNSSTK